MMALHFSTSLKRFVKKGSSAMMPRDMAALTN
jgi:hypothetical protein